MDANTSLILIKYLYYGLKKNAVFSLDALSGISVHVYDLSRKYISREA